MHKRTCFFSIILLLIQGLNLVAQNPSNPYKAPLYWDVYENNFLKEKAGTVDNYITEEEWLANINWVDVNLKSYGYNMICIDGWGNVDYNQYGYRTKHSSNWIHDYSWWSAELKKRGMTLGIYDNPLWVNSGAADAGVLVKGTTISLSSLINKSETAKWFTWLQVDRPGAQEYVKGYIQHYADMGVKYLRVDFLSWFESGNDRYMGTVGASRPLVYYENALRWMREACDANGIFLSLVMPNLNNEAITEQKYGHMIRIDEDCAEGTWNRFSDNVRGVKRTGWSVYANPFDGYIYWSKIAGRGKMILDGDFIRLNTLSNDEERKTAVSLHLIAGGPVSIADQYNTIGTSLWIYQNAELLALNADGFVGKPLSTDPTNVMSQIWKGQMTNGDWIVAFFNRETAVQTRSINFQTELGVAGNLSVRELWGHSDLGSMNSLSKAISSHGCQIFRISNNSNKVLAPSFSLKGGVFSGGCSINLSSATVGAKIYYTSDGTNPTDTSKIYGSPILVKNTSNIRAFALKSGMTNSDITSESYTITKVTPQTTMYIGASFNNWNLAITPMINSGGNDWNSNPIMLQAGAYELKFANTSNWSGSDWGNYSGLTGIAQLTTGGMPNITFTTPTSGSYIFTFNDAILNYSISNQLTALTPPSIDKVKVNYLKSEHRIKIKLPENEPAVIELIRLDGKRIYFNKSALFETIIPIHHSMVNSIVVLHIISESANYITKLLL